ncbi:MAG: GWxTD domain-containing protein [Acidobacteriota bacterium]
MIRMACSFGFGAVVVLMSLFVCTPPAGVLRGQTQEDEDRSRALLSEEAQDYYRKWLEEDVVYIVTPEEKDVFKKLSTSEEKERFIEQFWIRRDTDSATAFNEFREEHYRRIAYANENFYSGEPGWMTDRGRIYIIHGPPDQKESHPAGGPYNRPMHEGGGSTSTYPFEIWWYRHLEGVGSDVELEFVDRNGGNQYRLALTPEYKDALLHVQGGGHTLAEDMGIAERADRPYFTPQHEGMYPFMWKRAKDNPFVKYETFAAVQRPKEIKYKDLQEVVRVDVSYDSLAFEVRQDHFELNESQVIVPITIEWDNNNLSFQPEGNSFVARMAVYGMITSIQGRVVAEFEEDVRTHLLPADFHQGRLGRSMYQKIVVLDKKMRYKLDLITKDLASGKMGVFRQAIVTPSFEPERLAASSMILSNFIRNLDPSTKDDEMFVLGDVWIRPNLSKTFSLADRIGVYMQLYNFGMDQTSLAPGIETQFKVLKDAKIILEVEDRNGEWVHFFSGQRIVLVRDLPTSLLDPGTYKLEVIIRDLIKGQEVTLVDQFHLTSS